MYVCERPGWIKSNGQAVFVAPRWHIVTRSAPAIVRPAWIQQTLWALNRLYCPLLGPDGEESSFFAWLVTTSEFENSWILGARWCACWNLEMVSVDKFSQVREDLFPAQSLEKKRHLLEHDKHLATALWLMGPKTEVSSVHFQHWLIYPHFNLLYVLGGVTKRPPSPLTDGQYWMRRLKQFMQANTGNVILKWKKYSW